MNDQKQQCSGFTGYRVISLIISSFQSFTSTARPPIVTRDARSPRSVLVKLPHHEPQVPASYVPSNQLVSINYNIRFVLAPLLLLQYQLVSFVVDNV